MAIKRYIQGIAIVVLVMMGAMLLVMAAAPLIISTYPTNGLTINVNSVNVSVNTSVTAGKVNISWDGQNNVSMSGSGTNFYLIKSNLPNKNYNFTVWASDENVSNWSAPTTIIFTVNVPPAPSPPGLSNPNPTTPVNSTFGFPQNFNITVNQTANVSWKIDNVEIQTNSPVPINTKAEFTNNTTQIGQHQVTATAKNGSLSSLSVAWTWNVQPPPGPPSVSDINYTKGATWINWTWTNITTGNFNHTIVKINGIFQQNTSNNSFNQTNLTRGTLYTISLQTVDKSGNINSTVVSNSTSTLNTQTGINVIVDLSNGVKVNFSNVTTEGNTTKSVYTTAINNGTQFNIAGIAYDITTTAIFNFATIEMNHNSSNYAKVRLYHFENSSWKDVTTGTPDASKVWGVVSFGNFSPFVPGDVAAPGISGTPSPANLTTIVNDPPQLFNISFDQIVNITWSTNSSIPPASNISVTSASLFASSPGVGSWYITATGTNLNGSRSYTWIWNVRPKTFFTGNRIWDGSKPLEFALTYSWNPMSFSGFYYDATDDVGSENINITLGSYYTRTISKNKLVYTTSPQDVSFNYTNFGKYQVIGFMAQKYFAGYTINTSISNTRPTTTFTGKSAMAQGQLHEVLLDDAETRRISVGGTIALRDGYVLKATDIDLNARVMLISLLKDGSEVDMTPLGAGETYVYAKTVGAVEALPLIMVRFDSVFSGRELQIAQLKGIFQISENPTIIKTGNKFRNMEVTNVDSKVIEMKNSNDIGLTRGTTADIMGDVKILVANNDSVTRFALTVDKKGAFEVRSTVYTDANSTTVWTPYNFGMNIGKTSIGFYYDLDDGIGNETLRLESISGKTIPDTQLVYSTSPDEVKFTSSNFGKYQVIGFMADKYFAGYTANTKPAVTRPTTTFAGKSALANGALHKVLIDDDTSKTMSVGSTIALQEGYVVKATDIDLNARVILLSLMKDGVEVDLTPLGAGETYVYAKTVGGTEAMPLIMVRFESVFSGQELQMARLKGIFQISDTPKIVKVADQFGKMEVRSVSPTEIKMSNDGSIGLDKNKNDVLMGNLKLKTANNDKLRFYFAVDVTPEMIQNQLAIEAPAKAMAGDTINIKVKAGSTVIDNATVAIGTETGTTNKDGILNYTLPRSLNGTYSIAASKTGYEKATKNIEIEKYVDYRLSIEAPSQANQFETITIKVLFNGTAMNAATVTFDNTTIGTTDSNGEVTYKLESSGTHGISASKTSYITVTRDIEIRAPYSEFKALDINITPNSGFVGEAYLVKSNITNIGTKSDSLQVELIVNSTAVDNKTITLGAKEKVEVNFTRIETIAGNVTVEIMGQSMIYEAKVKPTNYLLIAGIATGIGIIIIYILTSKGLIDLALLKHKFGLLAEKFNNLFKK